MTDPQLIHEVIGAAITVHRELGPGLLEAVYEECPCHELLLRGLMFDRRKPLPVVYKGTTLDCGYRAEIFVCNRAIAEIKAMASIAPVHDAVMLTYLRLSGCKIGLLVNFHFAVLKDGSSGTSGSIRRTRKKKKTKRRGAEDAEKCRTRKFEC